MTSKLSFTFVLIATIGLCNVLALTQQEQDHLKKLLYSSDLMREFMDEVAPQSSVSASSKFFN